MTVEKKLAAPERRTRAEVQQLVAEFVSSGTRESPTRYRHVSRVRSPINVHRGSDVRMAHELLLHADWGTAVEAKKHAAEARKKLLFRRNRPSAASLRDVSGG